jgi:hypothetical protein
MFRPMGSDAGQLTNCSIYFLGYSHIRISIFLFKVNLPYIFYNFNQ